MADAAHKELKTSEVVAKDGGWKASQLHSAVLGPSVYSVAAVHVDGSRQPQTFLLVPLGRYHLEEFRKEVYPCISELLILSTRHDRLGEHCQYANAPDR